LNHGKSYFTPDCGAGFPTCAWNEDQRLK